MTTRMKYTCSIAMGPIDQLIDIAKTAEEVGFDAIALPDSLFYMEKAAADYPDTPDGVPDVGREHTLGGPVDRHRRYGRGHLDAAVLHQRDETRLPQPAAVGTPGRFGCQLDQ